MRFKCTVCGKVTAGRLPKQGHYKGNGTFWYPRRHSVGGNPCEGNILEADWVDNFIENAQPKELV